MLEQLAIQKLMNESFVELRLRNSSFSLRAYAQKLGLAPSAVSEIMKGKRKVSSKMAEKIADKLHISPGDRAELLALFFHRPLDPTQTEALANLNEKFHFLSKWYHQAILALVRTKEFKAEPEWLARRLGLKMAEAKEGFERLQNLGLVRQDDQGQWIEVLRDLGHVENARSAHQRHLQHAIEEASESFNRVKIENSHFVTHLVAFHPDQLDKVKGRVQEFLESLSKELQMEQQPTELFRVNLQVYQVSVDVNDRQNDILDAPIGAHLDFEE